MKKTTQETQEVSQKINHKRVFRIIIFVIFALYKKIK